MDVAVVNRQRRHRVGAAALAGFVRRVARAAREPRGDAVTVVLCGDAVVRRLNARFRGKDTTTDVLSFPFGGERLPDGSRPLGDIVISLPQAARQAREAGHPLALEVRLLALHGYLHLLGYDHEVDDGTMMRVQARLAKRLLAERA